MNENKIQGLTMKEAVARQARYGKNELTAQKKENFFKKAIHIIAEPMFLLLIVAAVLYFFLGEPRDGAVMLVFVLGMIAIDIVQEFKTDRTLNALRDLSAPRVTALRDGKETTILSSDLVPGDVILISEGIKIPADGVILKCSDLCVDESSLTGESTGVWKIAQNDGAAAGGYWQTDRCYAGTLVTQGSAYVQIDAIGASTEYGKIGQNIIAAPAQKSPLQQQTGTLVKFSAYIAFALFALVGIITFVNLPHYVFSDRLTESILAGITLAMAMIPEEFPVILTVFLSMGAWRLAKQDSLVRRLPAVETLGAVSVLCVDKTGTITQNRMSVQNVWAADGDENALIETMGLGCETDAYDPMEQAMLTYCEENGIPRSHLFGGTLLKEYAFTNKLKMMGHVWQHDGQILIAAKGSPERILTLCGLSKEEQESATRHGEAMLEQGLRVIAVAIGTPASESEIPQKLTDCHLTLKGLVGLADPPRPSVKEDISNCTKAGVRVVMITGDNGITAHSIAEQIGMPHSDCILTGDEIDRMNDEELKEAVKKVSIFSRVIPEHKMRIVKAFRSNGEVVAMTGDGVNDAPALKYADIGIAMGKRGSEVAREAADLILMDDNFSTIVRTVRDGRRIYDNIRKAIGYVVTIHIPIALASLLAPLLKIGPEALFLLPLHVVLLELIIDPTCSIVLERQPAEPNIMDRPPRNPTEKLLSLPRLVKSVWQGLIMFAFSFGTYYTVLQTVPNSAALARTMGLSVLILANLLLVLVNSSDREPIFVSIKKLRRDKVMWAAAGGTVCGLLLILYTPLAEFFSLTALSPLQLLTVLLLAMASTLWYEPLKRLPAKKAF